MNALEALTWHENAARSPSDETILAQRRRCELVEKRPAQVEMTPEQIVSFLDEHEVGVFWKPASTETLRCVTLISDSFPTTKGITLHQAVCRAAVRFKEANE